MGVHEEKLHSFELALRSAKIEIFNLVYVSSIFPPACKTIKPEEGLKELFPGQVVFAVLARCTSNELHRSVSASIGCAKRADNNQFGYLSENHSWGIKNAQEAGKYAEKLAFSMLVSRLGVAKEEVKWDETHKKHSIANEPISTSNTTQFALVKEPKYTTVVASAVFIL